MFPFWMKRLGFLTKKSWVFWLFWIKIIHFKDINFFICSFSQTSGVAISFKYTSAVMMSPKLNPEIALPAIIPSRLVVYIRMSHPVQYNTVLPSINHFLPRKDVSIRKIGKAIAVVTKIMLPGILKERFINFELPSLNFQFKIFLRVERIPRFFRNYLHSEKLRCHEVEIQNKITHQKLLLRCDWVGIFVLNHSCDLGQRIPSMTRGTQKEGDTSWLTFHFLSEEGKTLPQSIYWILVSGPIKKIIIKL